jgi:hypothetical protein
LITAVHHHSLDLSAVPGVAPGGRLVPLRREATCN